MPAFPVTAVDSVAAGDAFNGAFAAARDADLPFAEAVMWGAAAGALAVTRAGAQEAMPSAAAIRGLMSER